MRVAVLNFSGNVGKSTVARHLLAPRMNDAMVIAVETINSDGSDDEALKAKQFDELQETYAIIPNAVIDVGASNIEEFMVRMSQYKGSHKDFDFFVVPTVAKNKQLRDTISTIDALAEIGVPPQKIRLLFNMVEADDEPERVFSGLFAYQASTKKCVINRDALLHVNELYSKLTGAEQNINAIVTDPTDWMERLNRTDDMNEKIEFMRNLARQRLAEGVLEELDAAFKALLS